MADASVALKSARVYLNDINGSTWTDAILMGYLQEAHSELVIELERHSIAVVKNQTARILVSTGDIDLGNNQPANLIEPFSMMEGTPGDSIENFVDMQRVTFLPPHQPDNFLNYWCWINEKIKFLGATQDRQIFFRYLGSIPTPAKLTDPLGFIYAERFIGPRIAGLARDSVGLDGAKFTSLAESMVYKILQYNVSNDQIPTRRKAYRTPNKDRSYRGPSGTMGSV